MRYIFHSMRPVSAQAVACFEHAWTVCNSHVFGSLDSSYTIMMACADVQLQRSLIYTHNLSLLAMHMYLNLIIYAKSR